MKTMALKTQFSVAVLAAALLGGFAPHGSAQPSPTTNPWDLVISGSQRGVAQLTFLNDFTVSGSQIITMPPTHRDTPDDLDPRLPGGDPGRVPPTTTENPKTIWYGLASLQGSWTWDSKGNIVGVLTEFGGPVTNGISFKGSVRPGVRITLNVNRDDGRKFTYKGIPLVPQPSIAGNYYATGGREKVPFNEIMTLTPGTDPNTYDVVGTGPAYTFMGSAYLSGSKHLALYTLSDETTNLVLRSVSGPFKFSATTGSGELKGVSEDPENQDLATTLNVKMKLRRQ